jgi:hypothetical protein
LTEKLVIAGHPLALVVGAARFLRADAGRNSSRLTLVGRQSCGRVSSCAVRRRIGRTRVSDACRPARECPHPVDVPLESPQVPPVVPARPGQMIGGLVVTSVGDALVIDHPSGHPRAAATVTTLGGPALFLAGRYLLAYVVFTHVDKIRHSRLLALVCLRPTGASEWPNWYRKAVIPSFSRRDYGRPVTQASRSGWAPRTQTHLRHRQLQPGWRHLQKWWLVTAPR